MNRKIDQVDSSSLCTPADAKGAMTVGATELDDWLRGTSSRGPTNDDRVKPDVTAPNNVTNSVTDPKSFKGTSAAAGWIH